MHELPSNFFDSGEMERLVNAEGAFYASSSDRDDDRYRGGYESEHRSKYGDEHGHGKGRRRGFLGELFD